MSARTTRALDQHLALLETARTIETGLPSRAELQLGTLSGARAGHSWRVDVVPFNVPAGDARAAARWVPARVVIQVRGPSGSMLQVETVRLLQGRGG